MDIRALQKLQRDTGFNPVFLEKAYHIARILAGVAGNGVLANALALKGGTALNFVYLRLPRLSIDLDFNFVGAADKEKMLATRPRIGEAIARLARSLGCELDPKPGSYIMERFLLRYRSLAGPTDSVKLEINYLERVPVAGTVSRRFSHIFDLPAFKVRTYPLEEIAAMKTKAMAERLYARDIYDIFHVSGMGMRKSLLRKLVIFYLVLARKEPSLDTLLHRVDSYGEKEFVRSLSPFLREAKEAREVQTGFGDMKKQVGKFYRKLFVLNQDDRAFLKSLEAGRPDVGRLFRGIRVNPAVREHPGLMLALRKPRKK